MREAIAKKLEQVEDKIWDMEMGTIRPHMWTEYYNLLGERTELRKQLRELA